MNLKYVRMDDTMEIRTAELSDLDAIAHRLYQVMIREENPA